MQETANTPPTRRLTIRISRSAVSFSTIDVEDGSGQVRYEPYPVNNGISMAANLREAFRTSSLTAQAYDRVLVMVDSPVLMVPVDLFQEAEQQTLYTHSYPDHRQDAVLHHVMPDLNCVVVFSINKDLRMVIGDRFTTVSYTPALAPVWRHLHQRSYTGVRSKLYGYFHDKQLTIVAYAQNRFKFCNTFVVGSGHDALYFLLYVWKQLTLQPEHDEIHLAGDIPEQEWLMEELGKYVKRTYVINPAGDFNRAAVTQIKGMPYDLMTLYVKGK